MSAPHATSVTFLVLCSVIFVAFACWSLARARRTRDPIPLFLLAGGVAATLIEPMLDNLGLLWFARDNVGIAFHLFDRYMPVYVVLGYGFYFGGLSFVVYDGLARGRRTTFLWQVYAVGWVFDMAIESTGHIPGLYKYYGYQPFNIWGVPLWWMFINPVLPVVVGVVVYRLRDRLRGGRGGAAIVLLPMFYGAIYGGSSWAIFVALHSTTDRIWLNAAALLTDVTALVLVWLGTLLIDGHTLPPSSVDAGAGARRHDRLSVS
jgi:hypothetical protein